MSCSFCFSSQTEKDRMVTKSLPIWVGRRDYNWFFIDNDITTTTTEIGGTLLPPASSAYLRFVKKRAKEASGGSDTETKPIFVSICNSAVNPKFFILFHIFKPEMATHIRIFTLEVYFEQLSVPDSENGDLWRGAAAHRYSYAFGNEIYGGGKVSFVYNCHKHSDIMDICAEDTFLTISSICFHMNNGDGLKNYMTGHGEKVTLMIRNDVYSVYHGRANRIITNGSNRSYIWQTKSVKESDLSGKLILKEKLKQSKDFEEIEHSMKKSPSPRNGLLSKKHKKEGQQFHEKQRKPELSNIISPRRKDFKRFTILRPKYPPDNDEFSNPISFEPFTWKGSRQPLILELFNFRYFPPKRLVVKISWIDIYNAMVDKMKEEATDKNNKKNETKIGILKKIRSSGALFGTNKKIVSKNKVLHFAQSERVQVRVKEHGISLSPRTKTSVTFLCSSNGRASLFVEGIGIQVDEYETKFEKLK